jgi:gamma-glutamyl hydrolase
MNRQSILTKSTLVLIFMLHLLKAKVTLHKNLISQINTSEIVMDRGLSETIKVVGILTLPVSKLLRTKIHENIRSSFSESQLIDELNELDRMSFFPASYAKWLKVQGIQVIPVDIFAPMDELRDTMNIIDGILFTGGAVPLYKPESHIEVDPNTSPVTHIREFSFYSKKVQEIVKYAKQINKSGRVFPIWTTCLGFESLILGESNLNVTLANVNNSNYASNIKLVDRSNDFVQYFDDSEINEMESQHIFYFNHEHAFFVQQFTESEILSRKYKIIAEAFSKSDPNDNPIVAIIESKRYPFYGVQFHPEKNQFETKVSVDREPQTLSLLSKFSRFFCEKLQGNSSKENLDALNRKLSGYSLYVGTDIGVFDELYIFQKNN